MAIPNVQPGSAPANADVHQPSRRGMLGLLAAAPAVVLIPGVATASPPDRQAWKSTMVDFQRAERIWMQAGHAYDEVETRYFAERPERPSYKEEVKGDYGPFGKHVLRIPIFEDDLADPEAVYVSAERTAEMRAGFAAYHAAVAEVRQRLGLDALEARRMEAALKRNAALDRLVATPVADLASLTEKVAFICDEYDDDDDTMSAVLADVRRLAGAA